MKISSVKALEVLDSRGKPTVRAFIKLEDGSIHSSSVPSGASTGSHEAVELRDGDDKRFAGLGVLKAVENVNKKIAGAIKGLDVNNPKALDEKMLQLDATENKSSLGANAMLAVSQAAMRAGAYANKMPLWKFINEQYFKDVSPSFPRLMVNVVNGGKHAGWNFDIQEFMIVPTSNTPSKSVREAAEIFHQLGAVLKKNKMSTLVGDEGGYSPPLSSNEEVIETIIKAAGDIGYHDKDDFNLALDAAASEFYKEGNYIFKKTNQTLTGDELLQDYADLLNKVIDELNKIIRTHNQRVENHSAEVLTARENLGTQQAIIS
jgi:enolase